MKRANVLTEIIQDLQAYDLSHVEQTIMRLNARIANLPAEARVRFEPCGKCGIILTPGRKLAEHARGCIFPGLKWKRKEVRNTECLDPQWCGVDCNDFCDNCREDFEYARQCENEKMGSLRR